MEREIEIMSGLHHPRIIQLYDAYDDGTTITCILELWVWSKTSNKKFRIAKNWQILKCNRIEGGELFERVIEEDYMLTEKACTIFIRQICEGVEFLHSRNVLHLDLKPENVLCLTRQGNRIKIIDFGMARRLEPTKKLQILFGTAEFVGKLLDFILQDKHTKRTGFYYFFYMYLLFRCSSWSGQLWCNIILYWHVGRWSDLLCSVVGFVSIYRRYRHWYNDKCYIMQI